MHRGYTPVVAQRTLPDLPVPPELPEPAPATVRRAWRKVPYEQRFRRQRRDLLAAAARLAPERGIRGTSVAAIASGAGVSKRVFYEHFTDKQACFADVLRQIGADHLRNGVAAAEAAQGLSTFDTIRSVIRALVSYRGSDPRLIAAIRAESPAGSALEAQWTEHRRRVAELLASLAARLGSQLPEPTVRLAALLLVNGVVDLQAELAERRGAVRELATICCLAFGLTPRP